MVNQGFLGTSLGVRSGRPGWNRPRAHPVFKIGTASSKSNGPKQPRHVRSFDGSRRTLLDAALLPHRSGGGVVSCQVASSISHTSFCSGVLLRITPCSPWHVWPGLTRAAFILFPRLLIGNGRPGPCTRSRSRRLARHPVNIPPRERGGWWGREGDAVIGTPRSGETTRQLEVYFCSAGRRRGFAAEARSTGLNQSA